MCHNSDLGLAVRLHFEPRDAPGFEPLVRDSPQIRVVIDHLGHPFQGTPKEHAVVLGRARLPNTVMELSSLSRREEYPHRDVGPIGKDLTERFGPDRLIYGGGFGADTTGVSYRAHRDRLRSYLGDLSSVDQAKILGGTAARPCGFERA